jgi:hypothetical protein
MTVLSLQRLTARPRRRTPPIRHSRTARRERRAFPDQFFADPAAVEDDSRRMRRREAPDR